MYPEMRRRIAAGIEELEKRHPDVIANFMATGKAAFADGALDAKSKELICLAIAVAIHCDGCIAWHVRDSLKAGATEEEIVEALGVAITMGGGPCVAYATHALDAMGQFKAELG